MASSVLSLISLSIQSPPTICFCSSQMRLRLMFPRVCSRDSITGHDSRHPQVSRKEVDGTCYKPQKSSLVNNEISAFSQRRMERTTHAETLSHKRTCTQAYIVYTRKHTEPDKTKPTHSEKAWWREKTQGCGQYRFSFRKYLKKDVQKKKKPQVCMPVDYRTMVRNFLNQGTFKIFYQWLCVLRTFLPFWPSFPLQSSNSQEFNSFHYSWCWTGAEVAAHWLLSEGSPAGCSSGGSPHPLPGAL